MWAMPARRRSIRFPGMEAPPRQLVAFAFPRGSSFEGQLVGALERVESGGAMRILDALFVGREADSGELAAVEMTADSSAGMVGRLLTFRLEGGTARKSMTDKVLESRLGSLVRAVAENLEPGEAMAAVLVEHTWAQHLGEGISRMGGTPMHDEFVEVAGLDEAWVPLPDSVTSQLREKLSTDGS